MRWVAMLMLFLGPLLAAPAAAALWIRGELQGLAAFLAVIAAEAMVMARPGVLRQAVLFGLSVLWCAWLWLALTRPGYDWSSPPPWSSLTRRDLFPIGIGTLVYLAFASVAEEADSGAGRAR